MRVGMICPYSMDVPGGVQAHVLDLCTELERRGHTVSVLAPGEPRAELPGFVTLTGKALSIPYNGSVARLSFGPRSWRAVKRWLVEGDFDVLHIHEPNAPSLGMLALRLATGPIVATFHTSTTKSMVLSTFQPILAPYLEKIRGRIAVSALARRWQVEALGSDAVQIPNGVDVAAFRTGPLLSAILQDRPTLLFLGRFDEPRKGMSVLVEALPLVWADYPELEVFVIGDGDAEAVRGRLGQHAGKVHFLGRTSEADKRAALRAATVYVAPNLGGESFGIVLVEAMSAGTAVVASDLDAFRRVLGEGAFGRLTAVGDPQDLARGISAMLSDPQARARLIAAAGEAVEAYDWPVVAAQVERVYDAVVVDGRERVTLA